ncbi:hypothetical protein [Intestinibacter sp.]|uniref:hypothetical protein n=1 Tax=Intestinibacter sp. TaxID=1965304 RepID=UPI003F180F55
MKYKLYRDSLVKIWVRDFFNIEADSLEEAIEKLEDQDDFYDTEFIWETQEFLTPEENNGNVTEEIYDENDNLVYSNKND